jgi:hypothetical protein
MNSSRSRYFITSVVCVLACMGSKTAAAQSAAPCSLLSSNQVSAAIGVTAGAGTPIANTGCSWTVTSPHIIVTLSLWNGSKWDQMKMPLPGMTKTPVTGLGDDAVFTIMGPDAKFTTLSVKKGGTVYTFKVYGVDAPKQQSVEQALAANALANLH